MWSRSASYIYYIDIVYQRVQRARERALPTLSRDEPERIRERGEVTRDTSFCLVTLRASAECQRRRRHTGGEENTCRRTAL